MKTGIITFHHAFNYGAYLQAYALQKHIEAEGHDCEIIDYRNAELENLHERCISHGLNPFKRFANRSRRSKFVSALAATGISSPARAASEIDWKRYDAVFYGADEIWNHHDHAHGFDPVYFGEGPPDFTRRFAYAPSLGQLAWDHPAPAAIREQIGRFSRIAARDDNTARFVETMSGINPPIVLDPVFLWPFDELPAGPELKKQQVLVYGEFRDKLWIDSWKTFARKRNLETVSVGFHNKWCDRNMLAAGPFEFLSLLKSSRMILTSMFHGTMFAIKWNIPFATWRSHGARHKFDPLFSELNLEERLTFVPPEDWERLLMPLGVSVQQRLGERTEESKAVIRSFLA